jgi:carbamoyl-phosphate synthase large subunit
MAAGEPVEPHVGEFRAGHTFTRWYWQIELDEGAEPTARDIVSGGPRPATGGQEWHRPVE